MHSSIPAPAAHILDFIGRLEAPKGYDTIFGNKQGRMKRKLTSMTFDEVVAAQPGWTKTNGSSAAGRYQFMRNTLDAPRTMADIKGEMALRGDEVFSPDLQDRMAFHLLKRRKYEQFITGKISVARFGLELAREWASFPVLARTKGAHRMVSRGETYYQGDKLNHSLTSADNVECMLQMALQIAQGGPGRAERPPVAPTPAPEPTPAVRASVSTVEPSTKYKGFGRKALDLWNVLRGAPKLPPTTFPPAANVPGDPVVHSVQTQLLEKGYVGVRRADGIMGPRTADGIRLIQADNMLSITGVITPDFVAALPSLPARQFSYAQRTAGRPDLKAQVPEVTKPLSGVNKAGWAAVLLSALGGAQDSGILDTARETLDQATSTAQSAQSLINSAIYGVQWLVSHWWLIGLALGVFIVIHVGKSILQMVVLYRQGRLM